MNASPYFGFEQLGRNPNFEIALNMSLEQLRFYCTSNELFRSICSDQEFWLERLRREYPNLIQYKPEVITWGQYYLDAPLINQLLTTPGIIISQNVNPYQVAQEIKSGNIKFVTVTYNGQIIGRILMFPTDRGSDVYQRAVNLLSSINPQFNPDMTVLEPMRFATPPHPRKSDVLIGRGGMSVPLALNIQILVQDPRIVNNLWNNLQVINMYDIESYPKGYFLLDKITHR